MTALDLFIEAPTFALSLSLILIGGSWLYRLRRSGDLRTFLAYLVLVEGRRRRFFTAAGVMVASFSLAIVAGLLVQVDLISQVMADVLGAFFFMIAAISFIAAVSSGVRWRRASEVENQEMLASTAHFASLNQIDGRDPLVNNPFERTG